MTIIKLTSHIALILWMLLDLIWMFELKSVLLFLIPITILFNIIHLYNNNKVESVINFLWFGSNICWIVSDIWNNPPSLTLAKILLGTTICLYLFNFKKINNYYGRINY